MYTLTKLRLEKVRSILEQYRSELNSQREFDTHEFERLMKQTLDTGYQEMKDVAHQLMRDPRYAGVAVYYMENFAPGMVCSEFKLYLAEAFSVTHYESADYPAAQKKFWEVYFATN